MLSFECSVRPEFRARLAASLLQRADSDIALCCDAERALAPKNIRHRTGGHPELVQPMLDWIRRGLRALARRQQVTAVTAGATVLSSRRAAPDDPARNAAAHHIALVWRSRQGTVALLALTRVGPRFDPKLIAAAAASLWTIALADSSLPVLDAPARIELTTRQQQILELVSNGLTNAEVARLCGLSKFTVRNHLSRMFELFGATNRTELTHLFWENRATLVSVPEAG